MHDLSAALWVESLKIRRSKMPLLTAAAFSLIPLTAGLFMMIIKDPEWARSTGVISTKAEITTGSADWPTFFGMLSQAIAIGGLILFGLVVIWLFGREFAERTLHDLLAVPVAREATVAAKFVLAAAWVAVLTLLVFAAGIAVGSLVGLPDWSATLALEAGLRLAATAVMTLLLVSPFVLVASISRGYLPAVGSMLLVVVLAQISAALGWGGYFPWSVPALFSGVAGQQAGAVHLVGYLSVGLVGLAGVAGTLAWWRLADQC